jgi:hypothetical protein
MTLIAAIVAPRPASSATVFQCANKINGQLRVVDSPSQCLPSEKSITLHAPVVVHGSVFNGQVVANGVIGFTFSQPQAGQYLVTFDSAFDSVPTCQASIINPPVVGLIGYCTTITGASTTQVSVACRFFDSTGSATLLNHDFSLICIL